MELLYICLLVLFIYFLGCLYSEYLSKEKEEKKTATKSDNMLRQSKPFVTELDENDFYKGTIITYTKMRFGKYINRVYFASTYGKIPNSNRKFKAIKTSEKLVKNGYYASKFDLYAPQGLRLDSSNLNINYFVNLYDKTEGTNVKCVVVDKNNTAWYHQ